MLGAEYVKSDGKRRKLGEGEGEEEKTKRIQLYVQDRANRAMAKAGETIKNRMDVDVDEDHVRKIGEYLKTTPFSSQEEKTLSAWNDSFYGKTGGTRKRRISRVKSGARKRKSSRRVKKKSKSKNSRK